MARVRKTQLTGSLPPMVAVTFLLGMQSGSTLAAPQDQDVFTDFEGITATTVVIGTGNVTATFTNGFSATAGIPELYTSGIFGWMVDPGNTGEIQFETNAAIVEFFARTRSIADGPSVVTAFDSLDQVVDSVTLNVGDPFQLVSMTGSIARIEFANNATAGCVDCMNSIDDFGFSPVGAGNTTSVLAASLPASRSVQVGTPATAFGTIINAGNSTAAGCSIAPLDNVAADFSYQTTDPATNALTGTANTPVDIPAGASQSYVFAFTPTADIAPIDVRLNYDCNNTDPAPIVTGLNTLLFSASSSPVPDIVALAATASNDGTVSLPGSFGANAFAVATVNVGASATITASVDTGGVTLPLGLALCETNPGTGACLGGTGASVTTTINTNATPTFSIFVSGDGTFVPFDPANNRITVRFRDGGGVTRGSTSVAVQTL